MNFNITHESGTVNDEFGILVNPLYLLMLRDLGHFNIEKSHFLLKSEFDAAWWRDCLILDLGVEYLLELSIFRTFRQFNNCNNSDDLSLDRKTTNNIPKHHQIKHFIFLAIRTILSQIL